MNSLKQRGLLFFSLEKIPHTKRIPFELHFSFVIMNWFAVGWEVDIGIQTKF